MMKNQSTTEPTADFITQLLTDAIRLRASDIHFESFGDHVELRFRIDGQLKRHQVICPSVYPNIIARLKTLAQLDIAQTLRPQDGRLQFIAHQSHHIRIHTCPTLYHEKIVLRFLGDSKTVLPLNATGMTQSQVSEIICVLKQVQGLVICTGPTGSGKSMTLYALLNILASQSLAITTIEDPVEIPMPGLSQIPIQVKQGLDYTHILKSVLRQDPDVIMLGEIRDSETAAMAVRAALTGHLVLTTLHTRNASTAVTRLINMGIADHDLADALSLVIAQRLIRAQCRACAGAGCQHCDQGLKGRIGIFECITVGPTQQALIRSHQPLSPIFTLEQAYDHHIAAGLISPRYDAS